MQQVALQRTRRQIRHDMLVHDVVRPAGSITPKEPRIVVRVAFAVLEWSPHEHVAAGKTVHGVIRQAIAEGAANTLRQLRRQSFVGVQTEHPVIARQADGMRFLRAEADPGVPFESCAEFGSNGGSFIGTPRIHHNDFIGKGH